MVMAYILEMESCLRYKKTKRLYTLRQEAGGSGSLRFLCAARAHGYYSI